MTRTWISYLCLGLACFIFLFASVGTVELVSAVSNAGGLGIIGSGYYEPDWVRQQIHLTRQQTNKPFGINIQLASPYVKQVVELVLEEHVAIVTTGAGNPEPYIPGFKEKEIKVIPVVNNSNLAIRLEKAGADAVIAEGMESGGHVGEITTMVLLPQVLDSVKIPVIAAGGVGDGRGLAATLAFGAQGIQMGTRFVCSTECIAHPKYKNAILAASSSSTVVTRQILGFPQRSLKNKLTDQFQELEKAGASIEELELFDRDRMYLGLVEGDTEDGSLLAGQISGIFDEIKPVRLIIEEIIAEAEKIIVSLNKYYKED